MSTSKHETFNLCAPFNLASFLWQSSLTFRRLLCAAHFTLLDLCRGKLFFVDFSLISQISQRHMTYAVKQRLILPYHLKCITYGSHLRLMMIDWCARLPNAPNISQIKRTRTHCIGRQSVCCILILYFILNTQISHVTYMTFPISVQKGLQTCTECTKQKMY